MKCIIFSIVLVCLLLSGCVSQSEFDAVNTEKSNLQNQFIEIEKSNNELKKRLDDTAEELALVQSDLLTTQNELSDAVDELQNINSELDKVKSDLKESQDELVNTKKSLSETKTKWLDTNAQLSSANAQITELEAKIVDLQDQLDHPDGKLIIEDLPGEIWTGYTISSITALTNNTTATDPTYQDVRNFILYTDHTQKKQYIDENDRLGRPTYMCVNYAVDVHNNAEQVGLKAGVVVVRGSGAGDYWKGYGHALNVFETTDAGTIYIDCTQTDNIAIFEEGTTIIELPLSYFYSPPKHLDDVAWWEDEDNLWQAGYDFYWYYGTVNSLSVYW